MSKVSTAINRLETYNNQSDAFTTGVSVFSLVITFIPLLGLLSSVGSFVLSRRKGNIMGTTLSIVALVYNLVFTSVLIIGYFVADAVIEQIAPGSSISDLFSSFL